ncbi:MAG: DNA polymerase III subunit delta' [Nitrospinae bacterium]|nr:DNA polymerase III subunit delta' [Nitrospinota bacterium]MBF0635543.1 DNA polymerase III subunit delta' [Nitrospinota bacterium]
MLRLSQIMGQENALKTLKAALPPGQPAHSYLFTGPDGVGKRSTALAWAQALFCAHGGGDACGSCKPCVKVEKGNHPDLILVKPEIREKKVKEEIDIDHVRDLIGRLSYRPYESQRIVAIVDGADSMNVPAANALLKTLEEPPGETVIIIIASNMDSLLPTVVSRLRTVRFAPLPYGAVVEILRSQRGMSAEDAKTMAALSKGAPGSLGEEALPVLRQDRARAMEFISFVADARGAEAFRLATELDKSADKGRADGTLDMIREIVRDIISIKVRRGCDKVINMDVSEELEKLSGRLTQRKLMMAYDAAVNAAHMRKWNINPLLTMGLLYQELKER